MKFINNLVVFLVLSTSFICSASIIFINEIHYDNAGTDQNEFFEIMGVAGLDLSGWQVELYNGSNGETYGSIIHLSGVLADSLDFPDFARHQMSYIVTSTRGVYEQRQTVYPRI